MTSSVACRERYEVVTLDPGMFWSFAVPQVKEVEIPFPTPYMVYKVVRAIEDANPEIVNLMTEGCVCFFPSIFVLSSLCITT